MAAVWLVRILDGVDPQPGDGGAGGFTDVDGGVWWAPFVDRLAELGVTVGCSAEPLRFCPDDSVTRGQMASFLVRAFDLGQAPDAGFVDVGDGVHKASIDALAAAGVTVGCSAEPLWFCPRAETTRAQMATFLVRASETPPAEPDPEDGGGGAGPVVGPSGGGVAPERLSVEIEPAVRGVARGEFAVTLTFSAAVTDLEPDDVSATNGRVVGLVADPDDERVWTATVLPDDGFEGEVTVRVSAAAAGRRVSASSSFAVDARAPSVAVTGPAGPQSAPFEVRLTWSEPVDGFTDSDMDVAGASMSALAPQGAANTVWTATLTPAVDFEGDVVVSVAAAAATDTAGNASDEAAARFAADTVPPKADSAQVEAGSLVVTFGEPVGPTPAGGDFTVTVTDSRIGSTARSPVGSVSLDGAEVTLTLDAPVRHDDTVSMSYSPGVRPLRDVAGNPVGVFDQPVGNDTAASAISTLAALSVTPGTLAFTPAVTTYSTTVNNTVASATVTAAASDERAAAAFSGAASASGAPFSLQVGANVVTVTVTAEDGSTRAYTVTVTREPDIDTPTVQIQGPSSTQTAAFDLAFAWSETVTGFAASDVTLSAGTLSDFAPDSTDPPRWTATVTPATGFEGTITVTVPAGAASDGTNPSAAASHSFAVDAVAPTVQIQGPSGTQTAAFAVTFAWSETVTGFAASDVTLSAGTLSDLAQSSPGQPRWTATITPATGFEGTITVTVPAGAASDGTNPSAAASHSFAVDAVAPTVQIQGPSGTQTAAFAVTFAWSETVTGFAASDVTLSAGTLSDFVQDSTDPLRWTANVDPGSFDGTITVTVPGGAASDGANANPVASRGFRADTRGPSVNITVPSYQLIRPGVTGSASFSMRFTFSEPVTGFDREDVIVSNGGRGALSLSPFDVNTYIGYWVPDENGPVTVRVLAGAVRDAFGNPGQAGSLTLRYDSISPGATLHSSSSAVVTGAFDVSIDFGETVTGFTSSDLRVTNATVSGFSGSGAGYSVTVTASGHGRVTVSVPAGVAEDVAGRANTAGSLVRFRVVSATAPQNLLLDAGDGRITAQWQEPTSDTGDTVGGYRVEWKEQSQEWTDASWATVPPPSRAHTASGLTDGTAYDVRVAAAYGDTVGPWVQSSTTANPVADAAVNLDADPRPERLVVEWDAPANSAALGIDSYVVQWKTGDEAFSTERLRTVTNLDDLDRTIYDLDNGAVYVVRVTAMNGTTEVASTLTAAAPISAWDYVDQHIIPRYETDYPWLRETWDRDYIVELDDVSRHFGTARARGGFTDTRIGVRITLTRRHVRSPFTVAHELAHGYTLDWRAAVPGPIGIGFVYIKERVGNACPSNPEVWADLVAARTTGRAGGYLQRCSQLARGGIPDAEAAAMTDSVMRGEIPAWFNAHFDDGDGTLDLDAVWDAVTSVGTEIPVYHMRGMFGGYCSLNEAAWAVSRYTVGKPPRAAPGNPWVDGGCVWRRPRELTLSQGTDALTTSWQAPRYETLPEVTHYVVQWRSAAQSYDTTRQAVVAETGGLMSHEITSLTHGTQYFVRVSAVNSGSQTVFTDDDGHSRTAEATAVLGGPGRPGHPAAVSGDGEVALRWAAPDGSTAAVTGYAVQWRSGLQDYDSTRRLVVDGATTRAATVPSLTNGTSYTLRVSALAGSVTGVASEEVIVVVGAPGAPTAVAAVGGDGSLLVVWEAPADRGSALTGYAVQWRRDGDRFSTAREVAVTGAATLSQLVEGLIEHRGYDVRVIAVSARGRGEPSEQVSALTDAPGPPTDVSAVSKTDGGFTVSWRRSDPYYPNIPGFRPVRDGNQDPILDGDGNTVPQFRYDVQYRPAGDPDAEWCDYWRYRNLDRGSDSLDSAPFTMDFTSFFDCDEAPVAGKDYEFRVRAEYVWLGSGKATGDPGPWAVSSPTTYSPG